MCRVITLCTQCSSCLLILFVPCCRSNMLSRCVYAWHCQGKPSSCDAPGQLPEALSPSAGMARRNDEPGREPYVRILGGSPWEWLAYCTCDESACLESVGRAQDAAMVVPCSIANRRTCNSTEGGSMIMQAGAFKMNLPTILENLSISDRFPCGRKYVECWARD